MAEYRVRPVRVGDHTERTEVAVDEQVEAAVLLPSRVGEDRGEHGLVDSVRDGRGVADVVAGRGRGVVRVPDRARGGNDPLVHAEDEARAERGVANGTAGENGGTRPDVVDL